MFSLLTKLTLFLLAFATSLGAEAWVRGALTLHFVSGEVTVSELGEGALEMTPDAVPVSMPGLINCKASYGSSAFFSSSNRSYILFEGDGSYAIERFEQIVPDAEIWHSDEREASQSRTILNFRAGHMTIDSRNMLDSSQCLVETPLGRITVRGALWQMRIVYDPRSQIYDFVITCSDGRVRFTDLQGEQYTLRTGQRLSGAGSRTSPSIEVGEITEQASEQMQRFFGLVQSYASAANDLAAYELYFKMIEQEVAEGIKPVAVRDTALDRRPIVIEYAKDPTPVTPFRGELKPPSAYQADLF